MAVVPSPWGPIRITTVITAALVFALVLWRTRRPLVAVVTVVACLWSYEAIWNATDIAIHRWGWGPEPYWLMLAAGWTGWAWREGWRPNLALLAAFGAGHVLWVVSGFHYNYPGRAWTTSGDVWNVATKTLWLLAWGLGPVVRREALDGVRDQLREFGGRLREQVAVGRRAV